MTAWGACAARVLFQPPTLKLLLLLMWCMRVVGSVSQVSIIRRLGPAERNTSSRPYPHPSQRMWRMWIRAAAVSAVLLCLAASQSGRSSSALAFHHLPLGAEHSCSSPQSLARYPSRAESASTRSRRR